MEFQDIVKNFDFFYENYMNYNQSCIDFQTWFIEIKQVFRNVYDLLGIKDDVDGKLGQILVSFFFLRIRYCYLKNFLKIIRFFVINFGVKYFYKWSQIGKKELDRYKKGVIF